MAEHKAEHSQFYVEIVTDRPLMSCFTNPKSSEQVGCISANGPSHWLVNVLIDGKMLVRIVHDDQGGTRIEAGEAHRRR